METDLILDQLPYVAPFLFVDALEHIDDMGVEGYFTFRKELDFYKGHFKGNPVTPGVILTECCAQIGLVSLGIFLLNGLQVTPNLKIGLSSSQMEFYKPVMPGEKVRVVSKKIYYRFHKLKCEVRMYDSKDDMVCKGVLAGMLKGGDHG
jgi:3-hydroxyacyl-[acyl-carrier-protein] dehydratase